MHHTGSSFSRLLQQLGLSPRKRSRIDFLDDELYGLSPRKRNKGQFMYM